MYMKEKSNYKSKKAFHSFVRSHNLVNRIYDMDYYFGVIKNPNNSENIKKFFLKRLEDVEYVESLAKYFEKKLRTHRKNIDLRCNLQDLIYDLDYLKQYLV